MKRLEINPPIVRGGFSKYLNWRETSILIDLVKSVSPKVMIEFGCNLGITANQILKNVDSLEKYIGIDVANDHSPTLDCQVSEIPVEAGIFANDDRFFLLISPSAVLKITDLEECDAVFIDGDHSEFVVAYESGLAKELVRPGGIVVWHDYDNPAVQVTKVLDRLVETGWPIVSVHNSWLAFMRVTA